MKLDDPYCFADCHARGRSELSGKTGILEAAHLVHRGIGGGGLNIGINLVLLTKEEHDDHHHLKYPTFQDLLRVVAARHETWDFEIEKELRRLQSLKKWENPNDDRPDFLPAYPEASYALVPTRKRPARNNKKRRRAGVPHHPKQPIAKGRKRSNIVGKNPLRPAKPRPRG